MRSSGRPATLSGWALGVWALAVILTACSAGTPPEDEAATDEDADETADEARTDEGAADDGDTDGPDGEDAAADRPDDPGEDDSDEGANDGLDDPLAAPARAYFEAFATYQSETMQPMLNHAADGSPAYVYAAVQIANLAASEQQGRSGDPGTLRPLDPGVELCTTHTGERECSDFEQLTVDDGQLHTFTVDGEAIDGRLAAGGQRAEQAEVTVELLGAYHSVQADALVAALDIHNGGDSPVLLNPYTAEYLTDGGRQVQASNAVGPTELRAGASSYTILVFDTPSVGGTVYLTGHPEDFAADYEWSLPLQPFGD